MDDRKRVLKEKASKLYFSNDINEDDFKKIRLIALDIFEVSTSFIEKCYVNDELKMALKKLEEAKAWGIKSIEIENS